MRGIEMSESQLPDVSRAGWPRRRTTSPQTCSPGPTRQSVAAHEQRLASSPLPLPRNRRAGLKEPPLTVCNVFSGLLNIGRLVTLPLVSISEVSSTYFAAAVVPFASQTSNWPTGTTFWGSAVDIAMMSPVTTLPTRDLIFSASGRSSLWK